MVVIFIEIIDIVLLRNNILNCNLVSFRVFNLIKFCDVKMLIEGVYLPLKKNPQLPPEKNLTPNPEKSQRP